MVITYSRVWINRVRLPILLGVSWTGKMIFPCPRACLRIWSRETGSAVPSRVSLLISVPRLNLVLTSGIPPEFRGGVHLWNRHAPSGQSRVYWVTQLRTDGVHCRESAGTGPVNLKVFRTGAALADHHGPINIRLSFPHPLLVWSGHAARRCFVFRSSGTHELYTKWPRGEARRPRLRVRGGKVFVFELSGTRELHTVVCTV